MRLQTGDSLRAHFRGVDDACGQVEAVTGVEGVPRPEFDQLKGDRAAHHVDDLIVRVRVRSVDIVRAVGPGVKVQALTREDGAQFRLGGRSRFGPGGQVGFHNSK